MLKRLLTNCMNIGSWKDKITLEFDGKKTPNNLVIGRSLEKEQ